MIARTPGSNGRGPRRRWNGRSHRPRTPSAADSDDQCSGLQRQFPHLGPASLQLPLQRIAGPPLQPRDSTLQEDTPPVLQNRRSNLDLPTHLSQVLTPQQPKHYLRLALRTPSLRKLLTLRLLPLFVQHVAPPSLGPQVLSQSTVQRNRVLYTRMYTATRDKQPAGDRTCLPLLRALFSSSGVTAYSRRGAMRYSDSIGAGRPLS